MECKDCEFRTYDLEGIIEHFVSEGHNEFHYDNFPVGSSYTIKLSSK